MLSNWFSGNCPLTPDSKTVSLRADDVLVLCSDGTIIDEASLGAAVRERQESQEFIDNLLDESVFVADSDDATIVFYRHSKQS